ncbi:Eco57I restriction-modification methylase domain-containing protein [Larkinella punicea]|uniref:site-specific DNA-methyltransferase (adenine-specific) n=1 Tax=Larkinella punicea TaxID=2315727 RepID=A0A368JWC6_9BACT|nr:Eco57I restriction-modification methylase domain-containing protein [Larkinella punicea]RCR71256.1 endonuclease [Larkinella punicea]
MPLSKEDTFSQVQALTQSFSYQYAYYRTAAYSEAQLRIDYLNPLLKAFGWDVDNTEGKSAYLRDVIQEESIAIEENDTDGNSVIAKKNPDYTLRVAGARKLFVEAKKVSVDVVGNPKPAFQTRRYGWNAGLLVSILTNFDKIIVYDCRVKPTAVDPASTARLRLFSYQDLIDKFDEIYELLSFESVASGQLEETYSTTPKLAQPFDSYFLGQIEHWRNLLATDIMARHNLDEVTINYLVQRLLNRIVFLRICEDRTIEKYATLQQITNYEELKAMFLRADKRYNAGLFDFIEDELSLKVSINTATLVDIFNELYYPQSPYDFSVIDPAILSQIYEHYLGNRIAVSDTGSVAIVAEAEIAASDGVVPTPKVIVEKIVHETLQPLLVGKNIPDVIRLRIADICCGSGIFLLTIYDQLLIYVASRLEVDRLPVEWVIKTTNNDQRISIWGKQQILLNCLYGLDINPYAVEVAKFSLYLKLLEGETSSTTDDFVSRYKNGVLPSLSDTIKCGNALVDNSIVTVIPSILHNDELLYRIKPFDWLAEFPFLSETGGFDAIVGNPPYIRIQNMARYAAEELVYYQSNVSGYGGTGHESFDKYYLFIQRALRLLNSTGWLGYIVPNKFFTLTGGRVLREFIITNSHVHKLIHFGVTQIFPGRSTYTAILLLSRQKAQEFTLVKIASLALELWKEPLSATYPHAQLDGDPWIFISPQTETIFSKIRAGQVRSLKHIADIPVGLQTSADPIYIIEPYQEDTHYYYFKKLKTEWKIEKALCCPCLYKASLHLFQTVTPNTQLLFPYSISAAGAELMDEATLQTTYPYGWAYLVHHRQQLEKRSINGSKKPKWYQYGRSQSLTKFHQAPKLIWSVLSLQAAYAYDDQNSLFTGGGNGPYYAILQTSDYSLYYILAILSHPLWEAMIKAGTSPFRGGYYSHGRQFVESLPIHTIDFANPDQRAVHDAIVMEARQMIDTQKTFDTLKNPLKRDVLKRKLTFIRARLIQLVDDLYGITHADKQVVANDELLHRRETDN